MQSGLDRLVAGARQAGIYRCCGRLCVLVLGLMVSACANVGQIGNLGIGQILSSPDSPQQMSIAVESIDGPPIAVHEKFLRALKEEAGGRRITVVTSGEADYHLRGYLASHAESDATSITWVWDVYDAGQQRAFRLSGKDKAGAGAGWATADDQVLRRIARSGLDQLAVLAAAPRKQTAAATPAPQPERKSTSTFAWLDDWAPETAGIFRIIRGEDARAEPAATAGQPQVAEIPLPRSRPSPEEGPARTFASLEAR
jgi:hypothetical protein